MVCPTNPPLTKGRSKSLVFELIIVTGALLAASHLLFALRQTPWLEQYISVIVAVLFLYTPVIVLWKRERAIDFLDRDAKSFIKSLLVFLAAVILIFPPFLIFAHFWQMLIVGKYGFSAAAYPQWIRMVFFQLILIALPEEFFFRGYFQSTIDMVFKGRRRVLGADVGLGWIITAAVFALAHTVVAYQWWHFSIFFPALLFGWLRLKTGSITAPILFHAASNFLMDWFSRSY